jgi:hypothetical protein
MSKSAQPSTSTRRHGKLRTALFGTHRRGVVSILAMMFLVLFGSLGLAMTIASKGNLRTAATNIHVNRALGAAETGLAIARARLIEASGRFVIDAPSITTDYGRRLWDGSLTSAQGRLPTVLPAPSGFTEQGTPRGISQALISHFTADMNIIRSVAGTDEPRTVSAPAGVSSDTFRTDTWVVTPAVGIDGSATASGSTPAAFSIMFAPLANGTDVRIYATGYSSVSATRSGYIYGGSAASGGSSTPVTRTIWQDFRLAKRHKHLAVTPAKLMIGKNVSVTGDLGASFDSVTSENGDPITIKSDFYGLSTTLDRILNDFFAGVRQYDADGDNRLRTGHPRERLGLPSNATDYDSDGQPDNAFADVTGDGYVDDYDLFINFYDGKNGGLKDGRVALSNTLRTGTPNSSLTAEFTSDDDLSLLIDSIEPDRNRNGVSGFVDSNSNGKWDSGEAFNDHDTINNTDPDQVLGYRDGLLDRRDNYAKIRGRVLYKTSRATLAAARPNYANAISGGIMPQSPGQSPQTFSTSDADLPNLTAADFAPAVEDFRTRANGQTFNRQVELARGLASGAVSTNGTTSAHVESRPAPASTAPSPPARYFPSNMDNALVRSLTGQNKWEKTPFNAPSFSDWYIRPRFENMTFTNVTIPRGNNGLFVNCTFVGVTFIDSDTANGHQNWQLYGKMSTSDPNTQPTVITAALDKSDFLRFTTGSVADGPANYASFPDPPGTSGAWITGTARDTKPKSNNIRFHNCLFVGSIATASPAVYTHVRNKLQFTGSTRFVQQHPTEPSTQALNPRNADRDAVSRSSLMVPGYSVDIGHFNAPTDTFVGGPRAQNVNLQGTIVAGLLDIRGNASIDGTLLATFKPVLGQAPLLQYGLPVGNPANYNISLGYFGPSDGDSESVDPNSLPTGPSGRRIVGWDLDGDGLPDTPPIAQSGLTTTQRATAVEVPFYGYGRISMRWNPDLPMPAGIMLPVSVVAVRSHYGEGRP